MDRAQKPLLFVDVDGVISTYGPTVRPGAAGVGSFHNVDGIFHHIAAGMDRRLSELTTHFEMLWATGWGERANEHLVYLLGMPEELEVVEFAVAPSTDGSGHWKLAALTGRAGDQAAAWIDDGHNDACEHWVATRDAPTLLVSTDPAVGLTDDQVVELIQWSGAVVA